MTDRSQGPVAAFYISNPHEWMIDTETPFINTPTEELKKNALGQAISRGPDKMTIV